LTPFLIVFVLFKWILGIGAFLLTRKFLFGIVGFIIGSFIDSSIESDRSRNRNGKSGGGVGSDPFDYYRRQSSRYDFQTMLMALSAAVMKADGKVLKIELNYVKQFFNSQFGNHFRAEHLQILKDFLSADSIPLQEICSDIKNRLPYEPRVQLLHYLFHVAKSDGDVATSEMNTINRISNMLGVSATDFESIKNMFYRNVDSDYKILGVNSEASDEEIKKAYRKMAITFHPDKVAQLGDEHQKAAKEKFQQIQDAYEAIKKRRGFK